MIRNLKPKKIFLRDGNPDDQYKWVQTDFYETPTMPIYLFSITISDFKCLKGQTDKNKIEIGVCGISNKLDQLKFALEISLKTIEHYESYFGVNYYLPKCGNNIKFLFILIARLSTIIILPLDHVALPDFKTGLTKMYYNENLTPSQKTDIGKMIAHELAHKWFGALVTPKWWNELWLNEAFARYFEYMGLDTAKPEWKMVI